MSIDGKKRTEEFIEWCRITEAEEEIDLSHIIDWVERTQEHCNETGKSNIGPWFTMVRGRANGNPRAIVFPDGSGDRMVFPVFSFTRSTPGKASPGVLKFPRCPVHTKLELVRAGNNKFICPENDCAHSVEAWEQVMSDADSAARNSALLGLANRTKKSPAKPNRKKKPPTPFRVSEEAIRALKNGSIAATLEDLEDYIEEDESELDELLFGDSATRAPVINPEDEEVSADLLIDGILKIVKAARVVCEQHGITLPIGYRTTDHLARLAVISKIKKPSLTHSAACCNAWRIWISGRVSQQERAKLDEANLPAGKYLPLGEIDGQPDWYSTAKAVLDAGLPVYLVGPSGTGKTRFCRWYAEESEKKLFMVVGSSDRASREMWVSRRDVTSKGTKTVLGPAAKACSMGHILLLDEADAFDANSLIPLNPVLNGDKKVSVPVIGDLNISPDTRVIATANTNGRNRDRAYTGRSRLDAAFLNRFAIVLETNYQNEIDEKIIISSASEMISRLVDKTEEES